MGLIFSSPAGSTLRLKTTNVRISQVSGESVTAYTSLGSMTYSAVATNQYRVVDGIVNRKFIPDLPGIEEIWLDDSSPIGQKND